LTVEHLAGPHILNISASAIGYRIIFAGSLSPILPWNIEAIKERDPLSPTRDQQVTRGGDAREIDPVTTGSIDNVVSHEIRTRRRWPKNRPGRFATSSEGARSAKRRSGMEAHGGKRIGGC
jgi:hypothetical protein